MKENIIENKPSKIESLASDIFTKTVKRQSLLREIDEKNKEEYFIRQEIEELISENKKDLDLIISELSKKIKEGRKDDSEEEYYRIGLMMSLRDRLDEKKQEYKDQ